MDNVIKLLFRSCFWDFCYSFQFSFHFVYSPASVYRKCFPVRLFFVSSPSLPRSLLASSVLWLNPTPCELFGLSCFVQALISPTTCFLWKHRVSQVPDSSFLYTCNGLRPRGAAQYLPYRIELCCLRHIWKTSTNPKLLRFGAQSLHLLCSLCIPATLQPVILLPVWP
jgi:hypothetical protein